MMAYPDVNGQSGENKKKALSFVTAFLIAYLVMAVLITGLVLLGKFVNPVFAIVLACLLLLAFVCVYLYTTSRERAVMIHRCFDMGGWTVGATTTLMLLCAVPFVGQFIYFFVGFPVLVLLMVQVLSGKCDKVD